MIDLFLTEEYRKSHRIQPNLPRYRIKFCFSCSATFLIILAIFIIRAPYEKIVDVSVLDGDVLLESQKTMLHDVQLTRLDEIKGGKLSRHDVEIVLSRFNEDIRWSDMYSSIRTIYDKSENISSSSWLSSKTAGKVVSISNLGRESYAYLWHIVNNYDTLAAVTVFSQVYIFYVYLCIRKWFGRNDGD
jgi:hypothetical protein